MTRPTLTLDGPGWSLREAPGQTWRWYVTAPLPDDAADAGTAEPPGATPPRR